MQEPQSSVARVSNLAIQFDWQPFVRATFTPPRPENDRSRGLIAQDFSSALMTTRRQPRRIRNRAGILLPNGISVDVPAQRPSGRFISPGPLNVLPQHLTQDFAKALRRGTPVTKSARANQIRVDVRQARGREKEEMGPLIDRTEFRAVLKEAVKCIRQNLDLPGLKPLAPEQLMQWFQSITLEDLETVARELDSEV